MKKNLVIVLCFLMIGGVVCKKGTVEDAQKDLDGICGVYEGYYDVLLTNKSNPKKGVDEAGKYIEENKVKLAKFAKSYTYNPKAAELTEQFTSRISKIDKEGLNKIKRYYGRYRAQISSHIDAINKVLQGQ